MKTTASIATKFGEFTAHYSANGLAELFFPNQRAPKAAAPAAPLPAPIKAWHRLTMRAVESVLAGKETAELPPLDLAQGTDFQRRVWMALRQIPRGKVRTYGELAAAIGRPKASRAVGAACGANPIPLLVPCHRVVAQGGKLGGFTSGLEWKRRLLAAEAKS